MTNLIIELPTWEINKNELSEIIDKMQATGLNIQSILNELESSKDDCYEKINIEAYLSDQYDEFYLTTSNESEKENLCHIEVVTREVAISNDIELLKMSGSGYSIDEIQSDYKVGVSLSDYKKLGNSIYYYKEM